MKAEAYGASQPGRERPGNQDAFGLDSATGLYVLSDGMGGHAAGDRASREAVRLVLEGRRPGTRAASDLLRLRQQVLLAHEGVAALAESLGHQGNMGATLVTLWLRPARYLVASVGDSRAYLWRDGRLSQVNEDHTLVQGYVRSGLLSPAEAARHPQRNVLTQALGVGEISQDLFEGRALPGDRFLLTSDGVHGVLGHEMMKRMLKDIEGPRDLVEQLLKEVLSRGGEDDATALAVSIREA